MSVDQANARLRSVEGAGSTDTYNGPQPDDGGALWTGNAGVYYEQRRERVTTGDAQDVLIRRTLLVDTDIPVAWEEGQVLELWTRRQGTLTLRIQAIEETEPEPGQPGEIALTMQEQ